MARFFLPNDIYYGEGSLERLGCLEGSRAVLISGGLKKNSGIVENARSYLSQNGMSVRLLTETNTVGQAMQIKNGAKSMREFRPDWIVAIGDGTTISAAKLMWILFEHTWMRLESLSEEKNFPMLRKQARFAALPAGFGTAADASALCSVQDESLQLQISFEHRDLTPDITILDPSLMSDIPFAIAAYDGVDSLCCALSALISPMATMFTDAFANHAAAELFMYLPLSFNGNEKAKKKVYFAQFISGAAYANAHGGIIGEMIFQILSALCQYHLPRGCINAIIFPHLLQESKTEKASFEGVLRLLEKAMQKEGGLEELLSMLEELKFAGGIPSSFEALGVRRKDYFEALPIIAEGIAGKAQEIKAFPQGKREIERFLERAY